MLILVIMVIYVTMVYGPIAAFLVELFPTKIRYTSMSLPYHIGNGWFGGMLPLLATAMVAATGDIYYGLWYPIVVALMTRGHRRALPARDQGRRHHDRFGRGRRAALGSDKTSGAAAPPRHLTPRPRGGAFFCGAGGGRPLPRGSPGQLR